MMMMMIIIARMCYGPKAVEEVENNSQGITDIVPEAF